MNNFLLEKVKTHFPHIPTNQQEELLAALCDFVLAANDTIFLLKGYAGTGKTSIVSALIQTMDELKQPVILMAPTGRAAKVLSSYSNHTAYTIHKKIYRQQTVGDPNGSFSLDINLHKHTLFIVDEASMIANYNEGNFGSGNVMEDLIQYVYGTEGCRLILVGDSAQLPPVGQEISPALDPDYFRGSYLKTISYELTDVVRQATESGILWNATHLRQLITEERFSEFPKINFEFPDIQKISGEDLIEEISTAYNHNGVDDTIIISRSNKRANIFNAGVRNRILYREEELSSGDMLMIVKNNYFWSKQTEGKLDFIANGDVAQLKRIRHTYEMYGFRFADVNLYLPDYDLEIEARILMDTLQSESPSLTYEETNKLFTAVQEDYMHIGNKRERFKQMREDPWLNALQVKFAYAVTCHKAQGGQWSTVFLDQGYITEEMLGKEHLRWLYTAFTRATQKLYLVNWKEE
ncbi:MAG: AAA family ATPase [Paludibacteraceae bacterium]|nr:AAA family ATPase [Paludibacteraceae bacterium]